MLYFGSFNPIHNGHTSVARYVMEQGVCDELWFVVSPRNPLKPESVLAGDLDRLRMAEIAVSERLECLNVCVSDIEFGLPRPSYTIDTLRFLKKTYPDNCFSLLVGADIMMQIDRWRESEKILSGYDIYVYPRKGFTLSNCSQNIVYMENMPLFEFSSTDVRTAVANGKNISGMVSSGVAEYIRGNDLWEN